MKRAVTIVALLAVALVGMVGFSGCTTGENIAVLTGRYNAPSVMSLGEVGGTGERTLRNAVVFFHEEMMVDTRVMEEVFVTEGYAVVFGDLDTNNDGVADLPVAYSGQFSTDEDYVTAHMDTPLYAADTRQLPPMSFDLVVEPDGINSYTGTLTYNEDGDDFSSPIDITYNMLN